MFMQTIETLTWAENWKSCDACHCDTQCTSSFWTVHHECQEGLYDKIVMRTDTVTYLYKRKAGKGIKRNESGKWAQQGNDNVDSPFRDAVRPEYDTLRWNFALLKCGLSFQVLNVYHVNHGFAHQRAEGGEGCLAMVADVCGWWLGGDCERVAIGHQSYTWFAYQILLHIDSLLSQALDGTCYEL